MNRLLIVVLAAVCALAGGCNQSSSGPRYQIAQISEGMIVRLDTHTGDMRRFVLVLGGDVAAPSEVRIVHDHAAIAGCDELGHVGREVARDMAATKGGDTVLFGKSKADTDEAWAYICRKAAPSVTR